MSVLEAMMSDSTQGLVHGVGALLPYRPPLLPDYRYILNEGSGGFRRMVILRQPLILVDVFVILIFDWFFSPLVASNHLPSYLPSLPRIQKKKPLSQGHSALTCVINEKTLYNNNCTVTSTE